MIHARPLVNYKHHVESRACESMNCIEFDRWQNKFSDEIKALKRLEKEYHKKPDKQTEEQFFYIASKLL